VSDKENAANSTRIRVYGYDRGEGVSNVFHINSLAWEKQIDPTNSVESVGHIQCYCPALQRPRIGIHHGIWRDLMFSIRKSSTELNDKMEPSWHFPSALSPEAHAEWGLYKILEYMGLHVILPPGEG